MATKFDLVKQGEFVSKCSEMLPNGFQCTRAGEFWVTSEVTVEGDVAGESVTTTVKQRQVCRAHAIQIRSKEQQEAEGQASIPNLSLNEALLEKLNAETPAEQELNAKKLNEQNEVKTNEQSKSTESGATT